MAQAQCPNCGGYKVEAEKTIPITQTNTVQETYLDWRKRMLVGAGTLAVLWFCIVLGSVGQSVSRSSSYQSPLEIWSSIAIWWVIPFVIWGLWFALKMIPNAKRKAAEGKLFAKKINTVATEHHYYCWLCGYLWTWRTGTPPPSITVRPDLIAKGEQRLREEQAAFEDAAAHHAAEEALKRAGIPRF